MTNYRRWLRPRHATTPLALAGFTAYVTGEPAAGALLLLVAWGGLFALTAYFEEVRRRASD